MLMCVMVSVSIMILSIVVKLHSMHKCNAECHNLVVILIVPMLSVVMLSIMMVCVSIMILSITTFSKIGATQYAKIVMLSATI